jgi:hypothetical protein
LGPRQAAAAVQNGPEARAQGSLAAQAYTKLANRIWSQLGAKKAEKFLKASHSCNQCSAAVQHV